MGDTIPFEEFFTPEIEAKLREEMERALEAVPGAGEEGTREREPVRLKPLPSAEELPERKEIPYPKDYYELVDAAKPLREPLPDTPQELCGDFGETPEFYGEPLPVEHRRPVIVVPGITASVLYRVRRDGKEGGGRDYGIVWPPVSMAEYDLNSTLFPKGVDVLDRASDPKQHKEEDFVTPQGNRT